MARLTLAQARTALAELLQLLDVDGSPELLASFGRAIATAQRTLSMRERWLIPNKRTTQTLVIGRTVYPGPQREGIIAVGVQMDPNLPPTYIANGIALDDTPYVTGGDGPQRWDHRLVQGVASVAVSAGGAGYTDGAAAVFSDPADGWAATGTVTVVAGAITAVTITDPGGGYTSAPTITVAGGADAVLVPTLGDVEAVLLTPPPSQAWTLAIDYRDIPALSLADGDRLVMDEMAVLYTAALMVGPSSGSPRTATLAGEATEYLKGLRGYGSAGGSFQAGSSAVPSSGMVYRNGRWYPR